MSARAQAKGCQGVVIDGNVRDLNEHRQMKFPVSTMYFFLKKRHPVVTLDMMKKVFARSHSILPQNAFVRPSEVQVPITLSRESPVVVQPGDIIVADLDGIVAIPRDLVEQVIMNCEKYVAIDDQCMEALKEGHGVKETFAKYRGT